MKIDGFETVISIRDFKLNIKVNDHSICTFSAVINDDDVHKYTDMAKTRFSTQIFTEQNVQLMTGFVNKLTVKKTYLCTTIFVSIISKSYIAQENQTDRIFQCPDKTALSVAEYFKSMYNLSFQLSDGLNLRVEDVTAQKNTDDFTFLRTFVSQYKCSLWVENDFLIVGNISNSISIDIKTDNTLEKVLDYEIKYEKNNETLFFKTQKYIKNGSSISFNQKSYTICEVEITEEGIYAYYSYTAVEKLYADTDDKYTINTMLGRARVTSSKDNENMGRIEAEFIDLEDINKADAKYKIKYLSPYVGSENGGFIMLPDEGDIVEVYVFDNIPVAIGSERKEAITEGYTNTEVKSICIKNDKAILFDEEKIKALNGENVSITLEKASAEIKQEKNSIVLKDNALNIESDKKGITIDSSGIKADAEKSSLTLSTDVTLAGKSKLVLDSNATLTGSSIVLNGGKISMEQGLSS